MSSKLPSPKKCRPSLTIPPSKRVRAAASLEKRATDLAARRTKATQSLQDLVGWLQPNRAQKRVFALQVLFRLDLIQEQGVLGLAAEITGAPERTLRRWKSDWESKGTDSLPDR